MKKRGLFDSHSGDLRAWHEHLSALVRPPGIRQVVSWWEPCVRARFHGEKGSQRDSGALLILF
jgi:hypothetical protein